MQHYNLKRLDAGTRLATMFLDHMTMSFVLTIVVAPGLILDMAENFAHPPKLIPFDPEQHNTQPNWILMLVALIASMAFTYLALFLPFEIFLRTRGLL